MNEGTDNEYWRLHCPTLNEADPYYDIFNSLLQQQAEPSALGQSVAPHKQQHQPAAIPSEASGHPQTNAHPTANRSAQEEAALSARTSVGDGKDSLLDIETNSTLRDGLQTPTSVETITPAQMFSDTMLSPYQPFDGHAAVQFMPQPMDGALFPNTTASFGAMGMQLNNNLPGRVPIPALQKTSLIPVLPIASAFQSSGSGTMRLSDASSPSGTGGLKPSPLALSYIDLPKRDAHMASEQRRRAQMKEAYDGLAKLLPIEEYRKQTKSNLLNAAVRHISKLHEKLHKLAHKNTLLTGEIQRLAQQLHQMQTAGHGGIHQTAPQIQREQAD